MNCRILAKATVMAHSPQPNEMDLKRIERALVNRKRYRYVSPMVQATVNGYLITSPCCSRNIDPDGGIIDIARLEFMAEEQGWRLYHKDHKTGAWSAYADYPALRPILAVLRDDPERRFWQ
ncbi:DUF3024 domain-containing protein [Methyloglobulus morosus]|nr:DUF3024 domain-containing protein [Methyloglobulus morosus]